MSDELLVKDKLDFLGSPAIRLVLCPDACLFLEFAHPVFHATQHLSEGISGEHWV
jgi:hypothetical protein